MTLTSQGRFRARAIPRALMTLLAVGLFGPAGSPARADALDAELVKTRNVGKILDYIHKQKYRNVGVLPFQVKKGTRKASVTAAPLAVTMPVRLETALTVTMADGALRPAGIIQGAGAVAGKVGDYLSDQRAFARLFAAQYTVPWVEKPVSADAFLCGLITNVGDRTRTRVTIACFDKDSFIKGQVVAREVVKFVVDSDRELLADLGYSYALSRDVLGSAYDEKLRTRKAAEFIVRREAGTSPREEGTDGKYYTPDNFAGFSFEIFYGDRKQEITAAPGGDDGAKLRTYEVPPAAPGDKVRLELDWHRKDGDTSPKGVVVKVNGLSLWQQQPQHAVDCQMWLFNKKSLEERGSRQVFEGFYQDLTGKNLLPFKVLTAEESAEAARVLGGRIGWIDVHVFADKEGKPEKVKKPMLISVKGRPLAVRRGVTLAEYQEQLRAANRLKKKGGTAVRSAGGLLMHELEAVRGPEIEEGKRLTNPEEVAHIAIRFWDRGEDTAKKESPLLIAPN